jgi:site-specific DNA-methyltransferase (adenine-specific)
VIVPDTDASPYQLLPALSRDEYGALREDIRRRGIQVPVELDEHGNVLDGHHRVKVARELGLDSYPRIIRAGMTEDEKEEHALVLNLSRRHLTPEQRRDVAVALRARRWSVRRIAGALGVSHPTILRDLERSAGGTDVPGDERGVVGLDGKSYPARRKPTSVLVTTRHQQDVAMRALHDLGDRAPRKMTHLRTLERLTRDERAREALDTQRVPLPDGFEVLHCRMQDLQLPSASVDMVVCDPPYTRQSLEEGTWKALASFAAHALKPGGLLVTMSPTMWLPEVMQDLGAKDLDYVWMLTVTFPQHAYQVRQRGLASAYRPVLVYRRRGATTEALPGWTMDVLPGSGRSKEHGHAWEQSPGELVPLLRAWTRPGDLVVDPFLGTGTTGVAALSAGCRFIGCDSDRDWVRTAHARLAELAEGGRMQASNAD